VEEGRKRVLLFAAALLAARKLAQFPSTPRVPATISAISDGIRFANQIMVEIDRCGRRSELLQSNDVFVYAT